MNQGELRGRLCVPFIVRMVQKCHAGEVCGLKAIQPSTGHTMCQGGGASVCCLPTQEVQCNKCTGHAGGDLAEKPLLSKKKKVPSLRMKWEGEQKHLNPTWVYAIHWATVHS